MVEDRVIPNLKLRFMQALAIGFLVIYLGVTCAGWFSLDSLSAYAEYGFEVIFGGLILALYPRWEWRKNALTLSACVALFFSLAAGLAIFEATSILGYAVPFSFKDPETVLFLLVIGPLLEEWIFRGALWKLLQVITGSNLFSYLSCAVLFAYAHYQVIGQIDPQYAGFVRYQAIYTLGLGLFCGGMRMQYGWRAAWLTHIAFNFGFWLGALL
jgi:membrane protease YdiL (CAAX protease family)